jgi:hypothetical protein
MRKLYDLFRNKPKALAELSEKVEKIERQITKIMQTQKDLDDAIAALPDQIKTAIETALAPVIQAIKDKSAGTPVDFTPEITALQAIGGTVATEVATDLTPAP